MGDAAVVMEMLRIMGVVVVTIKVHSFFSLGLIQIFKKPFREILCIFDLFDNLTHFSLEFLIFTKNSRTT